VLAKLLINVVATTVLLLYMQTLSLLAGKAVETGSSNGDLSRLRGPSAVVHAGAGLLLLLTPATLSVYKPRGMTRYGWRKHYEQHARPAVRREIDETAHPAVDPATS
jgi:hypothetical protein